ncbi:MAG: LPXTG cell wall anchor domain-containing protein [Streptococcaceae bacterium]|jgi:LPXTG-motif cell wall-anchored protein|nr:LPXTG cell wall anchor domain-containing protein [Streptococcaceae bacterium]
MNKNITKGLIACGLLASLAFSTAATTTSVAHAETQTTYSQKYVLTRDVLFTLHNQSQLFEHTLVNLSTTAASTGNLGRLNNGNVVLANGTVAPGTYGIQDSNQKVKFSTLGDYKSIGTIWAYVRDEGGSMGDLPAVLYTAGGNAVYPTISASNGAPGKAFPAGVYYSTDRTIQYQVAKAFEKEGGHGDDKFACFDQIIEVLRASQTYQYVSTTEANEPMNKPGSGDESGVLGELGERPELPNTEGEASASSMGDPESSKEDPGSVLGEIDERPNASGTLPNTGEDTNSLMTAIGLFILSGAAVLFGLNRKKLNEK